jgi:hypothetical protein
MINSALTPKGLVGWGRRGAKPARCCASRLAVFSASCGDITDDRYCVEAPLVSRLAPKMPVRAVASERQWRKPRLLCLSLIGDCGCLLIDISLIPLLNFSVAVCSRCFTSLLSCCRLLWAIVSSQSSWPVFLSSLQDLQRRHNVRRPTILP